MPRPPSACSRAASWQRDEDRALLAAFAAPSPAALPRRRARRRSRQGPMPDARRAFRQMMRRDGEISRLPTLRRRPTAPGAAADRRLGQHEGPDRGRAAPRPRAGAGGRAGGGLHRRHPPDPRHPRAAHRNRDQALALAAGLVADWDGGTRLGEALAVFLSVPRFAGFARGALAVVLSDGLERGGPEALIAAMTKLRGLAWGVLWLTPLAADPAYRPETGAHARDPADDRPAGQRRQRAGCGGRGAGLRQARGRGRPGHERRRRISTSGGRPTCPG
jgi:uncharacterized protein